jgi:hypothetical protein
MKVQEKLILTFDHLNKKFDLLLYYGWFLSQTPQLLQRSRINDSAQQNSVRKGYRIQKFSFKSRVLSALSILKHIEKLVYQKRCPPPPKKCVL